MRSTGKHKVAMLCHMTLCYLLSLLCFLTATFERAGFVAAWRVVRLPRKMPMHACTSWTHHAKSSSRNRSQMYPSTSTELPVPPSISSCLRGLSP